MCVLCVYFMTQSTVRAVRLNRMRVVVVESRKASIYELGTLCAMQTLETAENERGLVALSANAESSVIALPSPHGAGVVAVHDGFNLCATVTVRAHASALAALALNADGTMLATASVKGTVIRVTSLPAGTKMWSFRRGATSSVIQSLNFGAATFHPPLLCVSSDKGTAHVFAIEGEAKSVDQTRGAVDERDTNAAGCAGADRDGSSQASVSEAAATTATKLASARAGVFGKIASLAGAAVTGVTKHVQPRKFIAAARSAIEPSRAIATVTLPRARETEWSLCALQPTPGSAADKYAPPSLDASASTRQLEVQLSVVTSDAVFYDYNVRLTADRTGLFASRRDDAAKESVARLERECKLIDDDEMDDNKATNAAEGSASMVAELPHGRWIETQAAESDRQELRTNVNESMSQSMFG